MRRVVAFAAVGFLGFLVEAGVILALAPVVGAIAVRFVSFPLAVTVTWLANHAWTFSDRGVGRSVRNGAEYLLSQLSGLALNGAIYAVLILHFGVSSPVLALAVGSAAAAGLTFCLNSLLVFRRRSSGTSQGLRGPSDLPAAEPDDAA